MPQAYTTIKTEKQLEENLTGLLRSRTRKASPMPQEHGPVDWYAAPLSLNGCLFRFPWSQEALRKTIKARVLTPTWIPCTPSNASLSPIDIGRTQ